MPQAPGDPPRRRPSRPRGAALLLAMIAAAGLLGLVNPGLQPNDLSKRYMAVVTLRVAAVDDAARSVSLTVETVHKGTFAPREVTVTLADDTVADAFASAIAPGGCVVAFVGQVRRGGQDEVLFYPGDGRWQTARLAETGRPERWVWTADLDPNQPETMYGTFNGQPERLRDMMADQAADRYFFPPVPFDRFQDDRTIDRCDLPLRGVGIHDLDGDGRADLIACAASGVRIHLQTAPLRFVESASALGLAGVASAGVSVADADGDGRPDLLLDGRLFCQRRADGAIRFTEAPLPHDGGPVKVALFTELNGDGLPDILVSRVRGGLRLLLHEAGDGARYRDASAAAGLDAAAIAGGDGFVAVGDWDGDGRRDLHYAIGEGIVLAQGGDGVFTIRPSPAVDLRTGGEPQGLTGAAAVGALWRPDGLDLVVPQEEGIALLAGIDGALADVTAYGNETTEGTFALVGAVAEDLNMDGTVDIYASSRSRLAGSYYVNRGYGSFMMPEKYRPGIFPGAAHQQGAWGVAAGDVDGDGANDLLLGGIDGTLSLLLSDVLAHREGAETATLHERILARTVLLSVDAGHGRGVVGGTLRVRSADGRILLRRELVAGAGTGNAGPAVRTLAIREPGRHLLELAGSDGTVRRWPIDCSGAVRHVRFAIADHLPAEGTP